MTTERQQTELNLDGVFDALRRPLDLVDNPERRADFERFIEAARVHQERAIFDLVSEIAVGINAASGANVRLEYAGGRLSLVADEAGTAGEATEPIFTEGDEVERVTIRLPAKLKTLIDQAAATSGTSVNSWYVRTLSRSIAWHLRRGRPVDEYPGWTGQRGRGRRHRPGPVSPE